VFASKGVRWRIAWAPHTSCGGRRYVPGAFSTFYIALQVVDYHSLRAWIFLDFDQL